MALFDQIRKKPESTRNRYALFLSGLVTGIIFIFWLLVWREFEMAQKPVSTNTEKSPLEALVNVVSDGIGQFKEELGGEDGSWTTFLKQVELMSSSTIATTTSTASTTVGNSTTTAQSTTTTPSYSTTTGQ